MARLSGLVAVLLGIALVSGAAKASYLDENPDEVFAAVYSRLGTSLPHQVTRDPSVWVLLSELKREPCDQTSIGNLALLVEKHGYRREAAQSLFGFFLSCGAPTSALHRSVDIFLKLTDYAKAVEVADEFIRRAPSDANAHYLRGVALEGAGDFRRALIDYANSIELFGSDKRKISSRVFLNMATSYAALGQFCEAASPIHNWVAIDPAGRDTSQTQKLIRDYEQRGNCASTKEFHKERYPLRGQKNVVSVKAQINGVGGTFILDTGASYVTIKPEFAQRAKVPQANLGEITLYTANGPTKATLSKADRVRLGNLEATNVPVVVQKADAQNYGPGTDGLLGMSFLSRFEMQMAAGSIEIRTRRQK
jgi:clan AA aspartic protease (TIGR02281 family)